MEQKHSSELFFCKLGTVVSLNLSEGRVVSGFYDGMFSNDAVIICSLTSSSVFVIELHLIENYFEDSIINYSHQL